GFPDEAFDLVCGSAILHHLDLGNALPELRRVLKPGGSAVFFEPLGTNPFINFFRRLTPRYRVAGEHPLRRGDLERIRAVFPRAHFTHFHFLSLLAVPFRRMPWFRSVHGFLERVDRALFCFAPLKRFAWVVVITAEKSGIPSS
ncbi:MAG: class I SAM-dependent methyltransferase, partial [Bacteroidota bacterium]|nr:class I SAM-dependent methyltransferase [Bacteroidota bacterium]